MTRFFGLMALFAMALTLAACGSDNKVEQKYPSSYNRQADQQNIYERPKSIFGEDGLSILGGGKNKSSDVITVNAYLWRAALDTVSFMPLATVDPFGGVILTDWYTSPDKPDERYKLNIFVMGNQLRSDGIRVATFKQRNGRDVDVPQSDNTAIEDAILNRARELRVAKKLDGE